MEDFVYFQDRSVYFAAAKYVEDRFWEYTYKSLTDTRMRKLRLRPRNSQKRNT
jgi:hypothetical protein